MIIQITKSEWDNQFKVGLWDCLDSLTEQVRYTYIAKLIDDFKPNSEILDIGCGNGTLMKHLSFANYTGMDISDVAISKAKVLVKDLSIQNTNLHVSGIFDFKTDKKFDVIVLSEVIYYFNPHKLILLLSDLLKDDGVIIITMVKTIGNRHIWNDISFNFNVLKDFALTKHGKKDPWLFFICKLKKK